MRVCGHVSLFSAMGLTEKKAKRYDANTRYKSARPIYTCARYIRRFIKNNRRRVAYLVGVEELPAMGEGMRGEEGLGILNKALVVEKVGGELHVEVGFGLNGRDTHLAEVVV